ncbi:MAG: M3 family oligoendopeptidase [Firmicutes bacterium]|nr:M3 family oligoendopeptidase [Bacillota bacterium]MDY6159707.1 M3 family oligoendopeptidase [Candidatus Faecousia sp.]
MNEVWNLDPIYKGFDDPSFARDLARLEEALGELKTFADGLDTADPAQGLHRGLALQETLCEYVMKLAGFAELKQAANTLDAQAGSQLGKILGLYSESAAPIAAFESWAAAIPNLAALIDGDDFLGEYRFLLENLKDSSRHLLPGVGERVMAKLKLSGSSAWSELQQYLTSTVPAVFRGEKTNLSALRNLAYSGDAQVRREAYEAELQCYDAIKAPVAYALNSIKLETINECRLRGYGSPLERTLKQSHMQQATLDAMFAAIQEYLPQFRRYLKAKAKALGHEQGLPWYDLFAPMGRASSQFTTEQARDYLVELFSHFDTELSQMVQTAFDDAWIDFYPRSGKAGGAFCAGVDCLGQSRILTNFDGQLTDVVTLAHELGHAFHNQCIRSHRILNHDYSMPLAETASTFNECVVMNHAIAHAADDQERLALIESQLQDVTQIIVDITSRYLFETAVLDRREQEFLDADSLCGMMLEAQRQSYGDGLDQACMHPYMWLCKSHYYGSTFYNFPYAFGGLFARGLYARYEQEGADFVPKYKKLLFTTPIATAEEVAKVADIDLTDVDFWRSALKTVAEKIDLFCNLVP